MSATLEEVSCPLCGSDSREVLFEGLSDRMGMGDDTFALARCLCGHAYLCRRPRSEHLACYYPPAFWHIGASKAATGVAALIQRLEKAYRRWLMNEELDRLRRWVPSGRRLLDVGCGSGDIVALASTIGIEASGLEVSPDAVAYARDVRGLDVHQGTLEQCDLEPASYDAVSLFHVLEHVEDPVACLREVRRLMKPGALLLVQVPNFGSWQAGFFGPAWYALDPPRHLQHFTPESLRRSFEMAGFAPEDESCDSFRCNPVSFATSLVPALEPRQGAQIGQQAAHRKALFLLLTWLVAPVTWIESKLGRGGVITLIGRPSTRLIHQQA